MGPSSLSAQALDQKSALIYFLFIVPLSAFATMLLHLRFPLNAAWSCSENLYFNLLTPKAGEGGLQGKYLLPCGCIRDSI